MTRGPSSLTRESRRAGTYGSLLSDGHGLLRGRLVLLLGLVPSSCKRARSVGLLPPAAKAPSSSGCAVRCGCRSRAPSLLPSLLCPAP